MSADAGSGGRSQPFYCPYCGEEDFVPAAETGYHCRSCDRRWDLRFLGLGPGRPGGEASPQDPASRAGDGG
ncbi:MAG: hypothetical protein ACRDJ4_13920 [Actinomycetota bacterium]